jgi:DNA repair protein RadD
MSNLRKYQTDLIKEARDNLKIHKSILIQGATGMGKTVLSSFMLKTLSEQNKRGLFLCHRRELIKQTSDSFSEFKINHEIIANGYKFTPDNPIQICSVGYLVNKLHLIKTPDFIIWDECHHIAASTWSKIFNYFPDAHNIGLTATPQRLDGKGLGKFFNTMIQAPSMRELINQGYLSDFDIYAPSQPYLNGVKTKHGDYDLGQLDKAINRPIITGCAVKHYKNICSDKKAIVFCVSISHSQNIVQKFNDEGVKAAHIDGDMTNKQRDYLIDSFKNGDLMVLSNVDIVGEGFDLPAIEAAILLRPTQSLTLFLQQVGRALRKSNGKTKAIILDHAGNTLMHGMPDLEHIWNLDSSFIKKNRITNKPSNYKTCPDCNLIVNKYKEKCDCGFFFKKIKDINQIDGDLIKVSLYEPFKEIVKRTYNNFTKDDKTNCWNWNLTTRGNSLRICYRDKFSKKKYVYNPKKITYSNHNNIDIKSLDHHPINNSCNNKSCVNPEHLIKDIVGGLLKRRIQNGEIKRQNPSKSSKAKYGDYFRPVITKQNTTKRQNKISLTNIETKEIIIFDSQVCVQKFLSFSKYIFMRNKDTNKPYKGYLIKSYLPF